MTNHEKILRSKLSLLKLVDELGNVSRACELMGYSRDSYYRFKELYERGGVMALQEKSRKKPNLKNRVGESVESLIVRLAYQQPFYGQLKASDELKKDGITVSPAGVRSVWQRYDLENFQKRLEAIGTKILQEGYHPSEWQIKALQQAKSMKNIDRLEAYFPGHLLLHHMEPVAVDRSYGDLFQFVLLDSYTRLAFIRLSNSDTSDEAVQSLRQPVLPFFAKENLHILKIGTIKEKCFYGKTKQHRYRKFAFEQNIEIDYLSKNHRQFNPLKQFMTRLNNEFYAEAFRSKTYNNAAAIQTDLDQWLKTYNEESPIYERYNYGKSPLQTFKAMLPFTNYLIHGKSKSFPNGLHRFIDLLKPLVIPANF